MLLDYFALNARDSDARKYLYVDIPAHYTFKKHNVNNGGKPQWEKRKARFTTIGRMYSVNPAQVELFHLRLLLLTIKGATSFNHLRTINGELQTSFTEACIALGLVADDYELSRAMHEAEVWMMPAHLRRLFVRILIHCHPIHPEELWTEFKIAMSEDFARQMSSLTAEIKALQQIRAYNYDEGKTMADFPSMPNIPDNEMDIEDDTIFEQTLKTGLSYYSKLNNDQKRITDSILQSTENQFDTENKCYYIDGPGGSGKTFMYKTLWYLLTGRKKKVQTMAFTGIAATLLPNGRTGHKTFGLPVPLYSDSNSTIKAGTKEAMNLNNTDVFIWDEAPMAPRYALEAIDRILRDIMNNNVPFGGKVIVFGGDFRQLLPVNIHGTRSETVNLSIKFSSLWPSFKIFHLTKNMRVLPEEKKFSKFLLQLGNGDLNDDEDDITVPEICTTNEDVNIAEEIFGPLIKENKLDEMINCAILAARNVDVDELNQQVIDLLDINTERIYTSVDSPEHHSNHEKINLDLLPEYLNSLAPSCLPPYELRLRKFAIVMLIRNLSINEELCNGTRLLILELGINVLKCEILTGDKAGETVFLNRITLTCDNVYPFTFTRRQFPIKLAFAITINKAQGQTFEKIGIDLRKDVFNHGQLYVALSRVRSWQSLKIFLGHHRKYRTVKNYVYKEVLL